jgi:hypothetical protein
VPLRSFLARYRPLSVTRRRNAEAAGLVGARQGEVLREYRTGGGLSGPPGLVVITLRPGSADEVLLAQIDAAVAAGYPRPPARPRGYGHNCLFPARPGWPRLDLEVIPAGHRFRARIPEAVPAGRTGVIVSLYSTPPGRGAHLGEA